RSGAQHHRASAAPRDSRRAARGAGRGGRLSLRHPPPGRERDRLLRRLNAAKDIAMNPVVIAVAITGSVPRKKDNPAVPILPPEQVESTREAYEAGATLVHIHVRNDDETSSSDPERFRQVQEGVNRHCPGMIVQFS